MRRTSWIVLALAGILMLTAGALYNLSNSEPAPPFTREMGLEIVERGKLAVERSDSGALMALFTDDAMILGRKRSNFRALIDKTFAELTGNFRMEIRDIKVEAGSANAEVRFVVDIGQRDDRMDAIYFPRVRMRAKLVKALIPKWLGLFYEEEWKVIDLTSDPQIVPRQTES